MMKKDDATRVGLAVSIETHQNARLFPVQNGLIADAVPQRTRKGVWPLRPATHHQVSGAGFEVLLANLAANVSVADDNVTRNFSIARVPNPMGGSKIDEKL